MVYFFSSWKSENSNYFFFFEGGKGILNVSLGSWFFIPSQKQLDSAVFAYQEALIKSHSFVIFVKTAGLGDLSYCLNFDGN